MSRTLTDTIAGWFGYVSKTEAHFTSLNAAAAAFKRGQLAAYGSAEFAAAVAAKAGEIEAERNGYKAQWEQAERRLKVANGLLQRAGKMPVTSFV
jgi:hypothetical protein